MVIAVYRLRFFHRGIIPLLTQNFHGKAWKFCCHPHRWQQAMPFGSLALIFILYMLTTVSQLLNCVCHSFSAAIFLYSFYNFIHFFFTYQFNKLYLFLSPFCTILKDSKVCSFAHNTFMPKVCTITQMFAIVLNILRD